MKIHKRLSTLFWAAFVLSIISLGIAFYPSEGINFSSLTQTKESTELPMVPLEEAFPYVIEPNTSLFSALRELDIPAVTIQQIVDAAKPVQNLAQLKPGIRFQVHYKSEAEQELIAIQFRFSAIESVNISKTNEVWTAEKIIEPVDIRVITYSGTVTSSLWESAQKAKMDPNLISELADIFGWEVDFAREVRENDRWRLTVEQKLVRGRPIGWGAILAAEYVNDGTPYQATLFRSGGEEIGYFSPEGASLRKMFLKSPVRYGRISSGFSLKRFHPILQRNRAHLGVDYAAPVGTPIRAVGDGTVIMAAYSGGAGNMVKLRHNATYQTAYKHMSGYAKGIHNGAHVKQGQIIGYVGSTGLSTGPHVHFEFYENGRYVDSVRKKFPSADPIPQAQLPEFKAECTSLLSRLPAWEVTTAEVGSENLGNKN